jgi:hypothetical protein
MYFALNFSDGSGIFDGKINIVTINGLRILYNDKSNGIYIANKNNRFVRIENDVVTIYKNITESPSIGTEQIEATEQYINYYGDKYGFHDYGYDGHDVVYEIYNPENATSNIRGKECKTLTAKVACCKNGKSKYTGFVYSNNTGWAESDSHILEEKCQAIQE